MQAILRGVRGDPNIDVEALLHFKAVRVVFDDLGVLLVVMELGSGIHAVQHGDEHFIGLIALLDGECVARAAEGMAGCEDHLDFEIAQLEDLAVL